MCGLATDTAGLKRWDTACRALENQHGHTTVNGFVQSVSNLPSVTRLSGMNKYGPLAAIAFATGLYGGIHTAAWNAYFPSLVEQRLWKICGVVVTSTGVVISMYIVLSQFLRPVFARFKRVMDVLGLGAWRVQGEDLLDYSEWESTESESEPAEFEPGDVQVGSLPPRTVESADHIAQAAPPSGIDPENDGAAQSTIVPESDHSDYFRHQHHDLRRTAQIAVQPTSRVATDLSATFWVLAVIYSVVRLYIVVESFLSFRDLPVEVYQTPVWSQWLWRIGSA